MSTDIQLDNKHVGGWDLNEEERKQLNYRGWEEEEIEEEVAKLTTGDPTPPKIPITRLKEISATSPNSTYSDVNCAIKFFGLVQKYRFPLNSNDWIQLKSRQADTISFFPFEMKSRACNNLRNPPLAALLDEDIYSNAVLMKDVRHSRPHNIYSPRLFISFSFFWVCLVFAPFFFFPPSAVAY
jgi:hypothetical protein